jgi:uncharacterized protein
VASEGLHEEASALATETRERHRAWVSLREEIEAIDWYDQRIDASADAELRAILAHNRDEEKEHAAMVLAWLAARDEKLAAELAAALARAGRGGGEPRAPSAGDGTLGIGSLRGRTP